MLMTQHNMTQTLLQGDVDATCPCFPHDRCSHGHEPDKTIEIETDRRNTEEFVKEILPKKATQKADIPEGPSVEDFPPLPPPASPQVDRPPQQAPISKSGSYKATVFKGKPNIQLHGGDVELSSSADGAHMAETRAGSGTGSVQNAAGSLDNAKCHIYHKDAAVAKTKATDMSMPEDMDGIQIWNSSGMCPLQNAQFFTGTGHGLWLLPANCFLWFPVTEVDPLIIVNPLFSSNYLPLLGFGLNPYYFVGNFSLWPNQHANYVNFPDNVNPSAAGRQCFTCPANGPIQRTFKRAPAPLSMSHPHSSGGREAPSITALEVCTSTSYQCDPSTLTRSLSDEPKDLLSPFRFGVPTLIVL
ncbi:hypothetical protein Q8A67_015256 [Cirrhinus molitorella]|uniref:Uncharacterized protein n=1 Tax=Cirrhinus molitorella TaxID=172907 RepID=A0AA88TH71_9TELE|nr:hypothetical protein Q8A67_015256 [Cirrhinus molitorella]